MTRHKPLIKPFHPSNSLLQPLSRLSRLILPLTLIISLTLATFVYASEMDFTKAVIHHTDTKDASVKTIRKYHVEVKKWNDVGYHFLIRENGDIETGRNINIIGAHAPRRNHWIGIALTGKNYFTLYQLTSLYKLLRQLKVEYIEPHYDDYACPGESLRDFIVTYNQGIK